MGAVVLSKPLFWFAVVSGAVGYGVMTLLMVASSLEMQAQNFPFEVNTYMIQAHVLAMFAPSLFSGVLVRWLRRDRFIFIGMMLMVGAAVTALFAPALWAFSGGAGAARSGVEFPVCWRRNHGGVSGSSRGKAKSAGRKRHDCFQLLCSCRIVFGGLSGDIWLARPADLRADRCGAPGGFRCLCSLWRRTDAGCSLRRRTDAGCGFRIKLSG